MADTKTYLNSPVVPFVAQLSFFAGEWKVMNAYGSGPCATRVLQIATHSQAALRALLSYSGL